jgi:hypothetical protein
MLVSAAGRPKTRQLGLSVEEQYAEVFAEMNEKNGHNPGAGM